MATSLKFHSSGRAYAIELTIADTPLARMRGLLATPPLMPGHGMLIRPCNMVHTIGMGYAIDVVFLCRTGIVLKVAHAVPPRRMRVHWRAHSVLELRAGEAARSGIEPGLVLSLGE